MPPNPLSVSRKHLEKIAKHIQKIEKPNGDGFFNDTCFDDFIDAITEHYSPFEKEKLLHVQTVLASLTEAVNERLDDIKAEEEQKAIKQFYIDGGD